MDTNWSKSLAWVLVSEKGNNDDPADSGGRTHDGITQREYNAYCDVTGKRRGDVFNCPDPVRDDIYHRSYWMPYCPYFPPGVDYVFFDENVNAGFHEAVLVLQRALGVVADGHIGVVTSGALSVADPAKLVDAMAEQRIIVYKRIEKVHPIDLKFDKGWMNRVEFCRANAHQLLGAS